MARYGIYEGSISVHCCFEYSVVDFTKPTMIHGEHYQNQYDQICECFSLEDATLICEALNMQEEIKNAESK